ncbi:MAG: hydrogenase maturation nickel metallochaperone HypA [Planctomycetota bacterium]|nr:hydrogenase maturation nickel metallochaperone HypA [Planctomycetota bacterium]
MHEVALAQAVWRQVASEMDRHKGSSLLSVRLLVGKWSGADPESLEFALQILAAESPWPKAVFQIRSEPLGLECRKCGRKFEPEELNLACPGCKSLDVEVVKGKDVYVESLEIE